MKKALYRMLVILLALCSVFAAAKVRQERAREELGEAAGVVVPAFSEQLYAAAKKMVIEETEETVELPVRYDYREEGRSTQVRDQGRYGTCWAFAALTALETSFMPEEELDFSRDHLNFQNHYPFTTEEGGSFIMSVAYLTAWQGPVLEEMDPYGDNASVDGLSAVKHVQEVRMPEMKDYEAIKRLVYLYGGVESSLYLDFDNPREDSEYYSKKYASYCYSGEELPNHDVVIIGWDDAYPAANFKKEPAEDGAFICQNSWGTNFGEDGIFYVSYADTHIGSYNVAYTGVEEADNYEVLYQSDLCGWCGQIGYNSDTGFMANVYEADTAQELQAIGFYATGSDTKYRLAVVTDFENMNSLEQLHFVQSGYLQDTGYYTIKLEKPVQVAAGQRFAVVVKVMTPQEVYPIAVEFGFDVMRDAVTLEDGEGYISLDGKHWEALEEAQESNLCLKVYANHCK